MGRTDLGLFGRWRGTVWWISEVRVPGGNSFAWEDAFEVRSPEADAAVRDFMVSEVVILSRTWDIWPRQPDDTIDFDDELWMWFVRQRRMTPLFPALAGVLCLFLGVVIANVLLPVAAKHPRNATS